MPSYHFPTPIKQKGIKNSITARVFFSFFSFCIYDKESFAESARISTVDLHLLTFSDKLLFFKLKPCFYKTPYLNEEVTCTDPSLFVSVPCGCAPEDLLSRIKQFYVFRCFTKWFTITTISKDAQTNIIDTIQC